MAAGSRDDVPAVVGRVGADDDHPGGAAGLRGRHRVGRQPARTRAEFADPLRNLVATITGADEAVDAVASNAFKPLTPA